MDRVRNALSNGLAIALAILALPRMAAAQHCTIPDLPHDEPGHAHHHHGGEHASSWWLVGTTSAIAGATTFMDESRDYEGLRVAAAVGTGRLSVRLAMTAYRMESSGVGLGDTSLSASADVIPGHGRVRAGVGASVAAPTGGADDGLGMGHWMIAGGPWLSVVAGRIDAGVAVSWASALGENSEHLLHQHVADGWPLVDPMNPREVMTVARVGAALVPGRLRAGTQLTFATPFDLDGNRRLVTAFFAERTVGRYGIQALFEVPVIGDPFVARAMFELSYRFPT
jgi:hypothetical protein